MIAAILASTSQGALGNRGTLPWPKHGQDLAWFRDHTKNNVVVMGRKTWDDPKMPKPLPDRINYVITNRPFFGAKAISGDIPLAIKKLEEYYPNKTIFVIGGKQVYEACYDVIDRIYLTRIKGNYMADTRIDLTRYLHGFRLKSVRPGESCTYEIFDRIKDS